MTYLKNLSQLTKLTLLAVVVFLLATSLALAQEGARVYLQPVESGDGSLTFEVMAENVTQMFGAEFRLKYDPALLAVQDFNAEQEGLQIEPGTLLPADKGFVVANQVDEVEGTITFAVTLLRPAEPANGTGPLARVRFNKLQDGPATIDIERAKLVAADLQTIPSQTEAFVIEGDEPVTAVNQATTTESSSVTTEAAPVTAETTTSAAGDSEFPWWIVAAAIMILGILALTAFIILGGLNTTSVSTESATPLTTKTDEPATATMRRTSTRPSAFK
jgi:hypothetical protein